MTKPVSVRAAVIACVSVFVLVGAPTLATGATREHGPRPVCPQNPMPTPARALPSKVRGFADGGHGLVGEGALWTRLPVDPGYVLAGIWSTKQPWFRAKPGELTIVGWRIDAEGGRFRADIPPSSAYGQTGFIPSGLEFSTGGCWQVTARLRHSKVTLYLSIDDSKAAICAQLAASLRNIQVIDNRANDRLDSKSSPNNTNTSALSGHSRLR